MSLWEELIRACSASFVITVTTEPILVTQLEMIGLLSWLMISMIIILGQIMQLYDALDLPSHLLLQALLLNQL